MSTIQVARYVIGLSWIYHGLFPKILQIAPIELAMSSSIGLSETFTYLLIKSAGIAEIIFGLIIIVFYRVKYLILLNIAALVALLLFVVIQMPHYLIEAFNPVTTNLSLIALSIILLQQLKCKNDSNQYIK